MFMGTVTTLGRPQCLFKASVMNVSSIGSAVAKVPPILLLFHE